MPHLSPQVLSRRPSFSGTFSRRSQHHLGKTEGDKQSLTLDVAHPRPGIFFEQGMHQLTGEPRVLVEPSAGRGTAGIEIDPEHFLFSQVSRIPAISRWPIRRRMQTQGAALTIKEPGITSRGVNGEHRVISLGRPIHGSEESL